MLDECKGERLEEVLSVFSTAVLKKILGKDDNRVEAVARQLAFENFSYTGERQALSSLILTHKVSLSGQIRVKQELKSRFDDFAELLDLKDRQLARRYEQWKALVEKEKDTDAIGSQKVSSLIDTVRTNWSGNGEWLDTITYGDTRFERHGLLAEPFNRVWKSVESGGLGDIEDQHKKGLVEQLDARVRGQNHRLAEWKAFEAKLTGNDRQKETTTGSPKKMPRTLGFDLGFGAHKDLQLGTYRKTGPKTGPDPSTEYSQMLEDMRAELASVGNSQQRRRPRSVRQSIFSESLDGVLSDDFANSHSQGYDEERNQLHPAASGHYIAPSSDDEDQDPSKGVSTAKSPSLHSSSSSSSSSLEPADQPAQITLPKRMLRPKLEMPTDVSHDDNSTREPQIEKSGVRAVSKYSNLPPSPSSSPLASEIVASVMATSPSPTKPRHVISLAERTRLSMSRTSLSRSQSFEGVDDLPVMAETPTAAITMRSPEVKNEGTNKYEDLIARTRLSLANMDSVAKNAQIERRRSIKLAEKRKRSSYLPKPRDTSVEETENMLEKLKLIEGGMELDYDAVFKSRPKVKTSPEISLVAAWGDLGGSKEEGFGSSSPGYEAS